MPRFRNGHYFDSMPDEELLASIDEGRKKFDVSSHIDYTNYQPKAKARYLVAKHHFPEAFEGSLSDIGDREGVLKSLTGGSVKTLDKNNPELESFDWDVSPLPFKDREFDSVFCLDTLEHITDIHHAFDDLLRISSSSVVISLPNC